MATQQVEIQCRGRKSDGSAALATPISVTVAIDKYPGGDEVSVRPINCPYNTGGHGQRCKASHPEQDKIGSGILCAFCFDYPHATKIEEWHIPDELVGIMQPVQSS